MCVVVPAFIAPPLQSPRRNAVAVAAALLTLALWFSLPASAAPTATEEQLPAAAAHGLAMLAPAGRWVSRLEMRQSGYSQVYDAAGNLQSNAAAFDRVNLDARVFPALALLGPGSSLGSTSASSRMSAKVVQLTLGYGVTENLTAGIILPWGRVTNSVNFSVGGGNIGFNAAFNPALPAGGANFPFAPVGAGASAPLDTAGMQAILTNPVFGLAYKPLQTATAEGLSDPTVGVLWRAWQGEIGSAKSSATLGLGVRLGISPQNDPDNLADLPLDDGSTDLIVQMETTHQLGALWDLRLQAKHTRQTEDNYTARVPRPGELLPGWAAREKLKRNLGDFMEYDIELGRRFGNWRASATWHRWDKSADRYHSSLGTDTSALEQNTRILADQWRLSLSWSGIQAWRNGSFPLPLILKLEAQQTYRGINMPKVWDAYLQATTFF